MGIRGDSMKKYILFMLCFQTILNCSRIHYSDQHDPFFDDMNKKRIVKKAKLIFSDGRKVKGRLLEADPDSILFYHPPSSMEIKVACDGLKEIDFKNGWKGAKEGAMIGAVLGFFDALGVEDKDEHGISRGYSAEAEELIMLPLFGGLIGAGIGSLIGIKERYVFSHENDTMNSVSVQPHSQSQSR